MSRDEEEYDNHADHAAARDKTGFWGRRAAGCIVFAKDTGRFLIAHRSLEVLEPGTWGTWGGAIDAGEEPGDAVLRELEEESGLARDAIHDVMPSFVFRHPSGFEYHNFIVVVAQEYIPELDDETQGYRWCTMDRLPHPRHAGLDMLLASDIAQQQIAGLMGACQPTAVDVDAGRLAQADAALQSPHKKGRGGPGL